MAFNAAFDDREFRRVLGHFATGVVVLTAHHADERAGVTVNSFSSLSLRPPLVLFSLPSSATTTSSARPRWSTRH